MGRPFSVNDVARHVGVSEKEAAQVVAVLVEQHWIEASPGAHSVRFTAEGWRVAQ